MSRLSGKYKSIKDKSSKAINRATDHSAKLVNSILASDIVSEIDKFASEAFKNGIPTVYDKAMDAVYNAANTGGGHLHRIVDGSHTLWGAWDKCREALPDDSFIEEVSGYFSALGHDLVTKAGLPVMNISQENYTELADWLSTFGVQKAWIADMMTFNIGEIFGASVASIAVILQWNKTETDRFSEIASALFLTGAVSANPIVFLISLISLAKAYHQAIKKNEKIKIANGMFRGTAKSGLFLLISSLVAGPAWVGILSAIVVYIITHKHIDKLELGQFEEKIREMFERNPNFDY